MKRLGLSLIFCAASAAPFEARALPSEPSFTLSIMDGPDPADATKVAKIRFRVVEDVGPACRYAAGWQGLYDTAYSTSCSVDELKTHGHASCWKNGEIAFPTVIVKPSRSRCSGFDTMARTLDIAALVGVVLHEEPRVVGLLLFAGGGPFVYAFEAEPEEGG
jgi:hypothetical protein